MTVPMLAAPGGGYVVARIDEIEEMDDGGVPIGPSGTTSASRPSGSTR